MRQIFIISHEFATVFAYQYKKAVIEDPQCPPLFLNFFYRSLGFLFFLKLITPFISLVLVLNAPYSAR